LAAFSDYTQTELDAKDLSQTNELHATSIFALITSNLTPLVLTDPLHYSTGEEVHAGDRVQYEGSFATVVFISDGESEEFSPGYGDYSGAYRGIVLCDDDGATSDIGEPDDRLFLVDRG
jgi:hypothetical protein